MKILITGGTGQLGQDCREVLNSENRVVSLGSRELDITRQEAVHQMVRQLMPDIILNCAAFTRVDDCETARDTAWQVNAEGPRNLAGAARKTGAKLIHISSDYVFDGKKPVPEAYSEADVANPISFYGKTKWAGEEAVREGVGNHMIVRTAWLYGLGGQNFLKTILRLVLRDSERVLRVVDDQFGSPTWSYRLALQIKRLMEADGRGTYHATSEGHCTWYELAAQFLEKMGVSHRIVACTSEDYPTPARRPLNSILENHRLKTDGLNRMKPWDMDLGEFVRRFRERLIGEIRENQDIT
ncbi:MAG: dTDP-4-dehydrorhamnose reductase [Deltaproteobacteria bacterium]|jgi:dTDP-4-dehydrorhamnose reductase